MATKRHSLLTGVDLHEPKGTSTAAAGTVYVADGAGSGDWEALAGTAGFGKNVLIGPLHLGSSITVGNQGYLVSPLAGTVTKLYAVVNTQTGSPVSLALTPSIGGVDITDGVISQINPATGTVYSATPSAANSVMAGQAIKITDASTFNTYDLCLFLVVEAS